jgi:signal transduction histidine kinase
LSLPIAADFGDVLSARIVAEHRAIAERWLHRLAERLPIDQNDVFPSAALLDHIPDLIQEIAAYLRAPDEEAIAANTGVIAKAQELGQLRHTQRASVHQVLQEYRILANILTTFVREETERLNISVTPVECIAVLQRLNDCVGVLLQTTVDTFVREYTAAIEQHASRLESFNRMISHELRQPLGTLQYAVALLKMPESMADGSKRTRLIGVLDRNVTRLIDLTLGLESLSRARAHAAAERQPVELTSVAAEAARQLREMAERRAVEIRIASDPCAIGVDVARLELVFINLLSNAIKYSDPAKSDRFVEIAIAPAATGSECTVLVRDNGLGIPVDSMNGLFKQFFRAHAHLDDELGVEGAGLGLSIAADCVQAMGGRITVASTVGSGTEFAIVLPTTSPTLPPRHLSEGPARPDRAVDRR